MINIENICAQPISGTYKFWQFQVISTNLL